MEILKDFDLTKFNTLGVKSQAKEFVEINNEEDLKEFFSSKELNQKSKVFLGGGSNILFTKDFDGVVVLNKLKGIQILEENDTYVLVRSMSGVGWHDLVCFVVDRGYWGIENLALIPGTVGGAPVQNIGAYGVELKDTLENVEAYNSTEGTKKVFLKNECEFGYRESVFKSRLKGQYFISAITLKLNKKENKNISYKILEDYLNQNQIKINSPKDVSDAVSAIRRSKLPDPKFIGNAGSFFKNVFIEEEKFNTLILSFPDLKYFKEGNKIKIPSAWLIESCGPSEGTSWKGYRIGNIGVHEKHALVLVNYGGGNGEDIKKLSDDIIQSVFVKFGVRLIPEVNFI